MAQLVTEKCDLCVGGPPVQAVVQIALRRRSGTWHLSGPMCRAHADRYGDGSITQWDGREELPL